MKTHTPVSLNSIKEHRLVETVVERKMKSEQEIRALLEADLRWIKTSYEEFMNGEMTLDCFKKRVLQGDVRVSVYRDILGEKRLPFFESDSLHFQRCHGVRDPSK
jgi:hypothetical protein